LFFFLNFQDYHQNSNFISFQNHIHLFAHTYLYILILFINYCIRWIIYLSLNNEKMALIWIVYSFFFERNRLWEFRTKTKIWKCNGTHSNDKWRPQLIIIIIINNNNNNNNNNKWEQNSNPNKT
jgi:hypothetical protein